MVEILDEQTALLDFKVVVLLLDKVVDRVVCNGVGIVVVHKFIVGMFVVMDSVMMMEEGLGNL